MKILYAVLVALVLLASALATTPQAMGPGVLSPSCVAVTTTGACTPLYLPGNSLAIGVTWQLIYNTGTASSTSVTFEGSNDNSLWTVLDTSTSTSNNSRSITITSYKYLRCNVGTYSLGTTNNLTCSMTVNPNGGIGSGGSGDVSGPGSSTANDLACYTDTSGKVIGDCSVSVNNVGVGNAINVTGPAYGAKCDSDGTTGNGTDDATALQAALTAGTAIATPAGKKCRFATALTIPNANTFIFSYGSHIFPTSGLAGNTAWVYDGTSGNPITTTAGGVVIKDVGIQSTRHTLTGNIATPTTVVTPDTSAGSLAAGTYYAQTEVCTNNSLAQQGCTSPSPEVTCVLGATGQCVVSSPSVCTGNASGYLVYFSSNTGQEKLQQATQAAVVACGTPYNVQSITNHGIPDVANGTYPCLFWDSGGNEYVIHSGFSTDLSTPSAGNTVAGVCTTGSTNTIEVNVFNGLYEGIIQTGNASNNSIQFNSMKANNYDYIMAGHTGGANNRIFFNDFEQTLVGHVWITGGTSNHVNYNYMEQNLFTSVASWLLQTGGSPNVNYSTTENPPPSNVEFSGNNTNCNSVTVQNPVLLEQVIGFRAIDNNWTSCQLEAEIFQNDYANANAALHFEENISNGGGIPLATWVSTSLTAANGIQYYDFSTSANQVGTPTYTKLSAVSLAIPGATSGSVTQTAQAAAGTPAIVWGTNSGTPAVSATSPLVISATTGNETLSTVPIASGGTNATTQQGALNNVAPTPTRAGDIIYYNGSNWVNLAGNNSGTGTLQESSGGAPSWNSVASPGNSAVMNTTPVTASASSTSEQALMEVSLSGGYLNTLNAPFLIHASGVYTTAAVQTPTLTFKAKLCTVSGCGSGTVITLASIVTSATVQLISNNAWNINLVSVPNLAGASGTLFTHGLLSIDLAASNLTADTVFDDTNTAASSAIDLTAALFIDFTVTTSSGNTGNIIIQQIGGIMPVGPSAITGTGTNGVLAQWSGTTGLQTASLNSGHIYVGNGSNQPADVALTGNCIISNTGKLQCTNWISGGSGGTNMATTNATTDFVPFAGLGLSAVETIENRYWVPVTGTYTNLYCKVSAAPGTSNSYAITLRANVGNPASGPTCTISTAATSCTDNSHTYTGAIGDSLDYSILITVGGSAPTAAGVNCAIEWTPNS